MGSDHDAVAIFLPRQQETSFLARKAPTSPRTLRLAYQSHIPVLRTELTCEWIQWISGKITQVKKRKIGFQESVDLKLLRRRALQASAPRQAAELWKQVGKTRKLERKKYGKGLADSTAKRLGSPPRNPNASTTAVAVIPSFKPGLGSKCGSALRGHLRKGRWRGKRPEFAAISWKTTIYVQKEFGCPL